MDGKTLFLLRYRQGSIGVSTGFLIASSLQKAEEVGKAWCSQEAFRRYISVVPAVVADESILAAPATPTVDAGRRKAS